MNGETRPIRLRRPCLWYGVDGDRAREVAEREEAKRHEVERGAAGPLSEPKREALAKDNARTQPATRKGESHMRQTKVTLKADNERLRIELEDAIYALRALARQAADRELLAEAHGETLVERKLGTLTVTGWAHKLLKDHDEEKADAK